MSENETQEVATPIEDKEPLVEKRPTNLADYDHLLAHANEGRWLHIKDPRTQEFNGISIRLLGIDSDIFQEMERELQRNFMKRATISGRKNQGMRGMRNERDFTPEELEELEEDTLRKLVACTAEWATDGAGEVILVGEERLNCTPENILRVYTTYPFIREQVADFVGARDNFF